MCALLRAGSCARTRSLMQRKFFCIAAEPRFGHINALGGQYVFRLLVILAKRDRHGGIVRDAQSARAGFWLENGPECEGRYVIKAGQGHGRTGRVHAAAWLAAIGALALSGCSVPLAHLPWVGEPANTPAPPDGSPGYLPI